MSPLELNFLLYPDTLLIISTFSHSNRFHHVLPDFPSLPCCKFYLVLLTVSISSTWSLLFSSLSLLNNESPFYGPLSFSKLCLVRKKWFNMSALDLHVLLLRCSCSEQLTLMEHNIMFHPRAHCIFLYALVCLDLGFFPLSFPSTKIFLKIFL